MISAHGPYLGHSNYHGAVGAYLSANQSKLGIALDEPTRKSGNARWLFPERQTTSWVRPAESGWRSMHTVPPSFWSIVQAVERGENPRATAREIARWFGFDRRGSEVNRIVLQAMSNLGLRSSPPFDLARVDESITFSPVTPIVVTLSAPPAPPEASREAPHPRALFAARIAAQTDLVRRVHLRIDALERFTVYLVSALLAVARSENGGQTPDALLRIAARYLPRGEQPGAPVSFGSWVELAQQLAALCAGANDLIAASARGLFAPAAPGALLRDRVVSARNEVHHASGIGAGRYREIETMLREVDAGLEETSRPLLDAELVCVHRTEPGETHAYRYTLRVLHGTSKIFLSRQLDTDAKLRPGWAHLLRDGLPPLRLAPLVFCLEDESTGEVETFFARSLALEPGQPVKLLALTGTQERTERMPP